jgi:hypothetical protein
MSASDQRRIVIGQRRLPPIVGDRTDADRFRSACALGVEGIVSKRKGSSYRSGRTLDWIKVKKPASPAAKRDAEGFDWGVDVPLGGLIALGD